jgi:NADPH:quinone reductase-like Zn-dependent oxidoreductase
MKAATRLTYGTAEVLSIKEVEKPTPKDNELLLRVYAATVNRTDCHILKGKPFFMRLFTGLFKPRLATTGTDFAGQVEATGKNVTSFKAGDKVIGFDFWGARSHAQYLLIADSKAVAFAGNINYEQAAASVEGAFYAVAVINKLKPKPGQKTLVIGATGAIGSAAVQLLKFYGADVTAVCSHEHSELVRSLGADKIIDYKTEDFRKDSGPYDFIFDAVGKSTFAYCKPLLKKNGIYSSSGGGQNLLLPFITPLFGGKKVLFAPPGDLKSSLSFIQGLVEKENFKPVIDRTYPLDKIAEAFTYVLAGQKIGNVILTMDA